MVDYLQLHQLLPEEQSAYRRFHSTETAMLKVLSDAYVAADSGQVTLLCLFDLSTAFDSVDHKILIQRLRHTCGFAGSALQWITSYLADRPQFVRFNGATSNVTSMLCGLPQGSDLGPVLFLLYVVEVIQLVKNCSFCPHAYADDLQVYGHALPTDSTKLLGRLVACIEQVQA